jgi:hypothetical protein
MGWLHLYGFFRQVAIKGRLYYQFRCSVFQCFVLEIFLASFEREHRVGSKVGVDCFRRISRTQLTIILQ